MGGGDFGSNGSVYWNIRHTIADTAKNETMPGNYDGKDPVSYADIGQAGGRNDGTFQLKLRYADDTAAQAALNAATITGGILTIKVVRTNPQRTSKDANGPWEIRIDW